MDSLKYIFLFTFVIFTCHVSAQTELVADKNSIAFDGYDLVSFFNGKTTKGKQAFQYDYKQVKVLFSSYGNLEAFKSTPKKYFPEYGGWCAMAMADGAFMIPDFTSFKIQEGRLLFFRATTFYDGLLHWNKSPKSNLLKADKNYTFHFK